MTTHILHAWKRDGEIHPMTICPDPKLSEQAARVYCIRQREDGTGDNKRADNAWLNMTRSGRVRPVMLECREVEQ